MWNIFACVSGKYKNDKKWEDLASWGKDLGVTSWSKDIVCMDTIHPKLFMGSRLSAQAILDKNKLSDQYKYSYKGSCFHTLCIASDSTCKYCEVSSKFKKYDLQDVDHQDEVFLSTAINTAKKVRKLLRRGRKVLVHCHTGRNRSALVILVYCARYTNMTYEQSLHEIRRLNSSRFPMQSTLQNGSFTSAVRRNWEKLRK
tara:strand:- start:4941 stop:5540 length:600 start_codon:yes stop_codon:yes gene_type:complete